MQQGEPIHELQKPELEIQRLVPVDVQEVSMDVGSKNVEGSNDCMVTS